MYDCDEDLAREADATGSRPEGDWRDEALADYQRLLTKALALLLFACVVIAALLVALAATPAARGAPAPTARRKAPAPPIPHACTVYWSGMAYRTAFRPDGSYEAWWAADGGLTRYVGTWALDRGTRVLTIREKRAEGDGWPYRYEIRLDSTLREAEPGGMSFRIE